MQYFFKQEVFLQLHATAALHQSYRASQFPFIFLHPSQRHPSPHAYPLAKQGQ